MKVKLRKWGVNNDNILIKAVDIPPHQHTADNSDEPTKSILHSNKKRQKGKVKKKENHKLLAMTYTEKKIFPSFLNSTRKM